MDLWGALNSAQSYISGGIEGLEEKIRKLQKANSDLSKEQDQGQREIKIIQQPDLANEWKGPRANDFDQSREAAYKDMESVFSKDYDEYQEKISSEIQRLQSQLNDLKMAMAFASSIEDGLKAVDDTLESAQKKLASIGNDIESLTKKVFS
ncbi:MULTISPECIES: DUF5082 family protein [Bacillaceae]|uniref:DUF5082 family protein n=1 Tax=Metabacillus sediminis TaxID=3117746 RepID=A0ABZ2NJY3_9BACI|nr:DUF5082 family protein [Bacillus sp. SJS]KZZ84423.1 hypothetical protein AS29_011255 [Bacillus sp. SJS]